MSLPVVITRAFNDFAICDVKYHPEKYYDKHVDGKSRISIILQGKVKEGASGKEELAQSGSIVFKPGDLVHQNSFGTKGSRILSVIFKDEFFSNKEDVKIDSWQWFHGVLAASAAFEFARNLEHVSNEDDLYDEIADLFSKLPLPFEADSNHVPPWLILVKEKIKAEFNHPIRTKDLAAYVGVHPVYLARAFRKYYGCSVKSFLQNIRLKKVLEELSNEEKPLTHVALDSGFSDQSHLNRVFLKNMKMSPGKFRKWIYQ